ncbi:MAG TPA: nucleotidyl transferase AbiEii/AbiGii toxin family protein [Anaerolineales bacterium]|nr:nucleotidyl transferase AbiEii/AbiGii toxin family protein [Anaerolineales bacterium]
MTESKVKNLPASVKARLANLAREQKEEFQELLSRYGRERLLYRLSVSEYQERFILKGALLFAYWTGAPHRPTRDMDLLGYGDPDIALLETVFRNLCAVEVEPDGLVFQADSVKGERIKDEEKYEGVRLHMTALLEKTRVPLQIDVGFGDRVVPEPEEIDFPTLLDFPAPHIKSYTRDSMVAEKFEAMVKLGMLNTRMKDFFDVWTVSQEFTFEGPTLCRAIATTFQTRGTAVPNKPPLALSPEFYDDREKNAQWKAFLNKAKLTAEGKSFAQIAEALRAFLVPVSEALSRDEILKRNWEPHGSWVVSAL